MRFLHTGDWQMGMRAAHVDAAAPVVRAARLSALRKLVEVATAERVEFILVAGDLFEHHGVDRVLVQQVADAISSFSGPVFIIPGNHDPLGPGSVWEHPSWKSRPNLTILTEAQPVAVPGGTLFPCPVREKRSFEDPTRWIDAASVDGIRIGVAHGTVEGVPVAEPDFPIARDAAARAGLDYLALGHWHSFAPYADAAGAQRMAYCGTHETSKFGERDSGQAIVVEIEAPGAAPHLTPIKTGTLTWQIREQAISEPGDLRLLREEIEALPESQTQLLDLRISGLLDASEAAELARIDELARARFLYARVQTSELRPRPGDLSWIAALPAGPVREAAAELQHLADPVFAGARPAGASPETAARALLALFQLTSTPAA